MYLVSAIDYDGKGLVDAVVVLGCLVFNDNQPLRKDLVWQWGNAGDFERYSFSCSIVAAKYCTLR
jgi:hypothetical protein